MSVWERLLTKKRYASHNRIVEDSHEELHRNSFHRDYDRLIFSNSFRRLSRKTQVHPLSKNDHVHNRLTHSLEVASVGRSLGLKAGEILQKQFGSTINANDVAYIVQTACLAHDIGNPPYGHAGEEVIKEWFKANRDQYYLAPLSDAEINDFIYLDGNAQSFRIVSQLENNFMSGGLRLTFATLGTLVKYPHPSAKCPQLKKAKFNFYLSEAELFDQIFSELGLKDGDHYLRHPLSYLMEVADDICYGLLDIQDAYELKIIDVADMKPIFYLICGQDEVDKAFARQGRSNMQKVSTLIAVSINRLTEHAMMIFEQQLDCLQSHQQPSDLIHLFTDDHLKQAIADAKLLARNKIFNESKKVELELGAYNIIETILGNLIPATYELYQCQDKNALSFRNKRAIALMDDDKPFAGQSLYALYQRVIDYLVGMTDNYAKHIANQLNGVGE